MITCLHCSKVFSNKGGLGAHQPYCKSNPDRVQRSKSPNAHAKKGAPNWAKGLTKYTDDRIKVHPDKIGKRFGISLNGHTEKTKQRLSVVAKERKLGGYVQGSGRGKKGWYKGYFCDSSWELAYIIYCIDHQIDIHRNNIRRTYMWKDKVRNYIPDFVVNGTLVEIKGWKTEQWLAKLAANPDIVVLYENDMKPILQYVVDTYGNDYIKLYEGR